MMDVFEGVAVIASAAIIFSLLMMLFMPDVIIFIDVTPAFRADTPPRYRRY